MAGPKKHYPQNGKTKTEKPKPSPAKKFIETFINDAKRSVPREDAKQLKDMCRESLENVLEIYELVMTNLCKDHAEVRFAVFVILDHLVRRSASFRQKIIDDLPRVLEMTLGTNPQIPLPLPKNVSQDLKRYTAECFLDWKELYGRHFRQLELAELYLKECKWVEFDTLVREVEVRKMREEETRRKEEALRMKRLEKLREEIVEYEGDVRETVTQLQSCFKLLVPLMEEFNLDAADQNGSNEKGIEAVQTEDEMNPDTISLRQHGIAHPNFSVTIGIKPQGLQDDVKETGDADVKKSAYDQYLLIVNRWLPMVTKWVHGLQKFQGTKDELEVPEFLKRELERHMERYIELGLKTANKHKGRGASDEESSDSDFEAVEEKQGFEEEAKSDPVPGPSGLQGSRTRVMSHAGVLAQASTSSSSQEWTLVSRDEREEDPTTLQCQIKARGGSLPQPEPHPSSLHQADLASGMSSIGHKAKLLAKAPKLPFDIDLYHWEDQNLEAPTIAMVRSDANQIWSGPLPESDILLDPEGVSALRRRTIEFTGQFQPVETSCNAPLPSGKLCPRRDRFKCPFHGVIVPRDSEGNPVAENEVSQPSTSKNAVEPSMQEEQGQKKKKNKRREKKKVSRLTDLKACQNTARKRLEKKLMNRSSVRRVASAMDAQDKKKFLDKFGNQFNYQ
ncbi:unnamed protein product [Darwinula stevensoni]|uniref:UV-stimulated scaffold protein A C-terminal domain-containing protein n=1 Tax=Darwinula stevensoni TaxID=69355 RepID=A0A7R8X006_9CRUS|nr:unnamed protein product [Darwinula stevensoni]CAG0880706.1 unnamed protein product [Darwinula stevensoni]